MDWETVTLGDISNICLGKMLDQKKNKGEYQPYLANVNIRWGSFELDNLPQMRFQKTEEERYNLHYGDILVCEGGEPGRCAIWKEQIPNMKFQKALHRVRVDEELADCRWLFYRLLFAGSIGEFEQYFSGTTTIKHMPLDKIKRFALKLPPLPIQHRIASILSAYDDLIENNRRQIKLLEEAAQRLYKEWFVDLRFPGHENVRIVDGVPEGWEYVVLSDFADVVMGQSPKSEFYNKEKDGLPFHQGVGSYGERYAIDDVYSNSFTRIASPGSILFSVRAPVGRLNITRNKVVIGRGLSAINHKCDLQSFLFYMLKHTFFKDNIIGNGAIYASISKNELLSQKFLLSSLDLSRLFNDKAMKIDQKIDCLDRQIQLLTEARDRLLPKLMSGEIEV